MPRPIPRHFEAISALQKCIRRGLEADAGYWFFYLAESGQGVMAFNRLRVIAYEDIGLGDFGALATAVCAIDDGIAFLRDKKASYRLCASVAILSLSRAKKSREADHFHAAMRSRLIDDPNREIPDFALDKHTRRGQAMGRGFDHFFAEGAVLRTPHGDDYQAEAIAAWRAGKLNKDVPPAGNDADDGGLFE